MKFKIGFLLGAAAGAWAVNKASEVQRGRRPAAAMGSTTSGADEAAEKLRAISGLARERLSDLVEGPIGSMARDRIADLIGTSLSSNIRSGASSVNGSSTNGAIDTDTRWPL
ncbi:MAG: hypothetical protein ACLPQS_13155 [Acidimicrobiales bacterium]